MKSTLSISASTSLSVCKRFPARTFYSEACKCSPHQSRRIVLTEIPIPAWPTHYSLAYNLSVVMNMDVNFRNHLAYGLVTNFVAKIYL